MTIKTFKTTNKLGVTEYQQMADVAGCIAIGRRILADDPTNTRAALLVAWADGLGHKPTDAEFEAFIGKMGVIVTPVEKIDYEN
ncbi:MAG: hypothetical protein LCI00_16980 [Chloroflexi bacterium]|nr:hypothetical protein [Chloroflexota bacterium]